MQKLRRPKQGDHLEVIWQDAISTADTWEFAGEKPLSCLSKQGINRTVGYFIKGPKDMMFLAQNYAPQLKNFSSLTGIPKGCIIKIRKK